MSLFTSPIENLPIKEYRIILNTIRETIDDQTIEEPFTSIKHIYEDKNIGEFCISILIGLKEKRKKSRYEIKNEK